MRKESAGKAGPAAGHAGCPTGRSPLTLALRTMHTTRYMKTLPGFKESRNLFVWDFYFVALEVSRLFGLSLNV